MILLNTAVSFFALLAPLHLLAKEMPSFSIQDQQPKDPDHILYLTHIGETAKALQAYLDYRKEIDHHDFELLEQVGLILLDQGYRSRDAESQYLTLWGAGFSANEKAMYILENGISSAEPEHQVVALHFLSEYQNDLADLAVHRAMGSNSLLIRLEAALTMCLKKDPEAVYQTEALMAKTPEPLWDVFPQLYAVNGSTEAKKILRKLLTYPDERVRIATISSLAKGDHDDFLPHIRRMLAHHGPAQQEACATALGLLSDERSVNSLLQLKKNPHPNVKLAALISLSHLGRVDSSKEIEDMATTGNLFAIRSLGRIQGSQEMLAKLMQSDSLQIKTNAAASLLDLGDSRCLSVITELLLKDSRDIALGEIKSQGKSLSALKATPSAQQNFEERPVALEISLELREKLLLKAIELPEDQFLALAHALLDAQQNDLVPTLAAILENHPSPSVIVLLKKHQQKLGAPLVRNYCNLILYRLKQPGPYAQNLENWVTQQRNIDLIKFRPLIPINERDENNTVFELTPQETSSLLLHAFESFAMNKEEHGIDVLISIIQNGNPKNKYALIGLLMFAIQ